MDKSNETIRPFKRVKFKSNIEYQLTDAEILMSFYDDDAAEQFEIWWNKEGAALFNKELMYSRDTQHLASGVNQKK